MYSQDIRHNGKGNNYNVHTNSTALTSLHLIVFLSIKG